MISVDEALTYHNEVIEEFGGSKGIRDQAGLEAALARPWMTFDTQDLYPTAFDKATAIFESLIINHPFIDGNKRTAYVLLRLTLMDENFDLDASFEEKYKMSISASMGEIHFDQIKHWITAHSIKI
jgi:death-on-curing protein